MAKEQRYHFVRCFEGASRSTVAEMAAIDAERLLKNLGRRIAEVRVERRLTQDSMAEELGISMKYLQRLERGRNMSLTTLVGVANKLRVGLDELLLTAATSKVRVGRPPKAVVRRSGRRSSPG